VINPTLVAIYARLSTSEQNPEAQLLALCEYAARRGFSIYKEYVDRVSGDLERRRAKRQNDSAVWRRKKLRMYRTNGGWSRSSTGSLD
jgi:hypothetical protein